MRVILMLIKKEFLQVFRNSLLWKILLVAPMAEFLLFPYTADYEVKTLNVAFIDRDHSTTSREIIQKFNASGYFINHGVMDSKQQADYMMQKDEIDLLIEFPADLEYNLYNMEETGISLTANAINSVKAGIGNGYAQNIIYSYMQERSAASGMNLSEQATISTTNIYWFNEKMNYKTLIVPGLLVILVTLIGAYVTALNIVREKEIGTIEQINVTPIKKWQFLLGKMIPFWILGMGEFILGLGLMYLMFGITIQGSFWLLLGATAVYLFVMLGLGFFISNVSGTQLQAMFIVFFLFIVFVLLSGLFTPIEGMPEWAVYLNYLNPMYFFMDIIKLIILKGGGMQDIQNQLLIIAIMAVLIDTAAVFSYRDKVK
ncbi:MAG: ABC transporter permease [Bacteroidales bacterium]|nr:ABC transporter permease [Bacteroidales bacterium]